MRASSMLWQLTAPMAVQSKRMPRNLRRGLGRFILSKALFRRFYSITRKFKERSFSVEPKIDMDYEGVAKCL